MARHKDPKRTVHFLPIAEADFDGIVDFIAADNRAAAERLVGKMEQMIGALADFSHMGKVPNDPELAQADYRYLIVDDYLIFYTIEQKTVLIHRIIHGASTLRRASGTSRVPLGAQRARDYFGLL